MREQENETDLEIPVASTLKAAKINERIAEFIESLNSEFEDEAEVDFFVNPVYVNIENRPDKVAFSGINIVEVNISFEVKEDE